MLFSIKKKQITRNRCITIVLIDNKISRHSYFYNKNTRQTYIFKLLNLFTIIDLQRSSHMGTLRGYIWCYHKLLRQQITRKHVCCRWNGRYCHCLSRFILWFWKTNIMLEQITFSIFYVHVAVFKGSLLYMNNNNRAMFDSEPIFC